MMDRLQPIYVSESINSQTLGSFIRIPTVGMSVASAGAIFREGAWPTSLVLTLQSTINGYDWDTALYTDPSSGIVATCPTFTAAARRRLIRVEDTVALRLIVTTVSSGGHGNVECSLYGVMDPVYPLISGTAATIYTPGLVTGVGGSSPSSITSPVSPEA